MPDRKDCIAHSSCSIYSNQKHRMLSQHYRGQDSAENEENDGKQPHQVFT